MIEQAANRLAILLVNISNEQGEEEIVAYGLVIFLYALIKFMVTIGIGLLLGILPELIAIVGAFAILRLVSGGYHCSSFFRCMLLSNVSFLVLAFLAINLANYVLILMLIQTVIIIIAILYYVPAKSDNRVIENDQRRKQFKLLSFTIFIAAILVQSMLYILNISNSIITSIALGMIYQGFLTYPMGYGLIDKVDKLLKKGGLICLKK